MCRGKLKARETTCRARGLQRQKDGTECAYYMSLYFPTPDEFGRHTIFLGVEIKTCVAEKMMLSVANLAPHAVVEEHSHPHEQVGMVLEGRAVFTIGGEERTLGAGDLFCIPGNIRHKVVALDQPVKVLDVFHPVREEYR